MVVEGRWWVGVGRRVGGGGLVLWGVDGEGGIGGYMLVEGWGLLW